MLGSTFIIDDDFTLDVIEEPEENHKIVSPKCEENSRIAEEVKTKEETEPKLSITEDCKNSFSNTFSVGLVETDVEIKSKLDIKDCKDNSNNTVAVKQEKSEADETPQQAIDCNAKSDKEAQKTLPGKKGNFTCSKCDYKTDRYLSFLSHIDAHLQNQKQYKCKSCTFSTFQKGQLTIHKAHCNYVYKIFCTHCSYVTTRNKLLRRHMDSVHFGVRLKIFRCQKCKFRCHTKDEMMKHRNELHPKIKYKCERCDFETTSKGDLKKHESVHTGARRTRRKKHKCELCEFEHANKKIIWSHMRIHHKVRRTLTKQQNNKK